MKMAVHIPKYRGLDLLNPAASESVEAERDVAPTASDVDVRRALSFLLSETGVRTRDDLRRIFSAAAGLLQRAQEGIPTRDGEPPDPGAEESFKRMRAELRGAYGVVGDLFFMTIDELIELQNDLAEQNRTIAKFRTELKSCNTYQELNELGERWRSKELPASCHNQLLQALMNVKRWDEAMRYWETTSAVATNHPTPYLNDEIGRELYLVCSNNSGRVLHTIEKANSYIREMAALDLGEVPESFRITPTTVMNTPRVSGELLSTLGRAYRDVSIQAKLWRYAEQNGLIPAPGPDPKTSAELAAASRWEARVRALEAPLPLEIEQACVALKVKSTSPAGVAEHVRGLQAQGFPTIMSHIEAEARVAPSARATFDYSRAALEISTRYYESAWMQDGEYYAGINVAYNNFELGHAEYATEIARLVQLDTENHGGRLTRQYWCLATQVEASLMLEDNGQKVAELLPRMLRRGTIDWMLNTSLKQIKVLRRVRYEQRGAEATRILDFVIQTLENRMTVLAEHSKMIEKATWKARLMTTGWSKSDVDALSPDMLQRLGMAADAAKLSHAEAEELERLKQELVEPLKRRHDVETEEWIKQVELGMANVRGHAPLHLEKVDQRQEIRDLWEEQTADLRSFLSSSSYGFEVIGGNRDRNGIIQDMVATRATVRLIRQLLREKHLNGIVDSEELHRSVDELIWQMLGLGGNAEAVTSLERAQEIRPLEFLKHPKHGEFEDGVRGGFELSQTDLLGDHRSDLAVMLALGLGDCRLANYIKTFMVELQRRDRSVKLIRVGTLAAQLQSKKHGVEERASLERTFDRAAVEAWIFSPTTQTSKSSDAGAQRMGAIYEGLRTAIQTARGQSEPAEREQALAKVIEGAVAGIREIQRRHLRVASLVMMAPIKMKKNEAGEDLWYEILFDESGRPQLDRNEAGELVWHEVEAHTATIEINLDDEGYVSEVRIRDPFYNWVYPITNEKLLPEEITESWLNARSPMGWRTSDGESIPFRMKFASYSKNVVRPAKESSSAPATSLLWNGSQIGFLSLSNLLTGAGRELSLEMAKQYRSRT
jgi:hypothetical protein